MTKYGLVSCIIIFYDAQKFFEEAINSVLNQTYRNWELILVDDGSSDKSTEIAKAYHSLYPDKIFYYEHPGHENRGMSTSRNLGLRNSHGDFIAFLDADDVWLPGKLEQQVAIMERYPEAAMVYGRSLMWYNWPGSDQLNHNDEFLELGVEPNNLINPPQLFHILVENKYQSPTTCCAMIRSKIFESIGFFEEHFKGMFEDQVFFAKVNLHFPVYVSDECWAKYRQHNESCSSKNSAKNYYKLRAPFIKWLDEYISMNEFDNISDLWKTIKFQHRISRFSTFYNFFRKHIGNRKVLNDM